MLKYNSLFSHNQLTGKLIKLCLIKKKVEQPYPVFPILIQDCHTEQDIEKAKFDMQKHTQTSNIVEKKILELCLV